MPAAQTRKARSRTSHGLTMPALRPAPTEERVPYHLTTLSLPVVIRDPGVFSPLTAAKATFALKAGVWFRRGRLVMVLYVGFAGRSIISGLWQGSGQPVHRLGIKAWRRDCGPAPHTLLIRYLGADRT